MGRARSMLLFSITATLASTSLCVARPWSENLADVPFIFHAAESSLLVRPELSAWASRLPLPDQDLLPAGMIFNPLAVGSVPHAAAQFVCDRGRPDVASLTEGRSAAEPAADQDGRLLESGVAAWNNLHGRTASGEKEDPMALTAAHRTLPLGSQVRVVNRSNGASAVVRINDRGPVQKKFAIDLSEGAARALGFRGTALVSIYLLRRPNDSSAACENGGGY
jgi:rare lipoprotein A